MASESITQARKDFDQLSKLDVNTARVVHCEDAFRTVLKAGPPFNLGMENPNDSPIELSRDAALMYRPWRGSSGAHEGVQISRGRNEGDAGCGD